LDSLHICVTVIQPLANEHCTTMGTSLANVTVPARNYLLSLVLILQTLCHSLTPLLPTAYDRVSDYCSRVATMFSNMSPRTPQSHRKVKQQPTYYEDIYGVQDADEAFDRSADVCESEPDTDNEGKESKKPSSTRAKSTGFFKAYALESDLRVSGDSEEDETAPLDEAGAVKGTCRFENFTSCHEHNVLA